jgi:hypothetical protein
MSKSKKNLNESVAGQAGSAPVQGTVRINTGQATPAILGFRVMARVWFSMARGRQSAEQAPTSQGPTAQSTLGPVVTVVVTVDVPVEVKVDVGEDDDVEVKVEVPVVVPVEVKVVLCDEVLVDVNVVECVDVIVVVVVVVVVVRQPMARVTTWNLNLFPLL